MFEFFSAFELRFPVATLFKSVKLFDEEFSRHSPCSTDPLL